jgi:hypothetical protein
MLGDATTTVVEIDQFSYTYNGQKITGRKPVQLIHK